MVSDLVGMKSENIPIQLKILQLWMTRVDDEELSLCEY